MDRDSVDSALLPLFEATAEWFEDVMDQYETATGMFGSLVRLTPTYAVFSAHEKFGFDTVADVRDHHRALIGLEMVDEDEMAFVDGVETAIERGEHATWVETSGGSVTYESDVTDDGVLRLPKHVHVFEYVPFETRVETRDDLRRELDRVMDSTPDWDDLFEAAEGVAKQEMV